jgi:hypothetical protein
VPERLSPLQLADNQNPRKWLCLLLGREQKDLAGTGIFKTQRVQVSIILLFLTILFRLVDTITWVKRSEDGKLQTNPGYWLRHGKEMCLVGLKGTYTDRTKLQRMHDVFFAERMEHSRKPDKVHKIAERLFPDGQFLEIFGRKHNLRDNWKTIGNEL